MLLTTYVVRVAIASVLLFGGILWLARTTSIEELMLNAVALNSILDVDEFLFAGMAPIKIQHAIQNVTPIRIRYSRYRSQLESLVHFSALLTLILLSYFLLLVPLSDAMLAVKSELCGGIQRFVVSYNAATQMTIGLATTNFDDVQNLSYSQTVILAHRDSVPGIASELIGFAANHDSFQSEVSRTMEEEATRYPTCIETEVLKEGSPYYTDPTLQSLAALLINSAAGAWDVPVHEVVKNYRTNATIQTRVCCGWCVVRHVVALIRSVLRGTKFQHKVVLQLAWNLGGLSCKTILARICPWMTRGVHSGLSMGMSCPTTSDSQWRPLRLLLW